MSDFYLDVYDTNGVRQFVITDFTSLGYVRVVNSPGVLQFGLRGDHPLVSVIQDKWQVDVWRKPDGGVYARDFVGLVRQEEFYYGEKSTAIVTCSGLMSMLSWRIVAWYAGTLDRSKFVGEAAETIMKTLVSYNAGAEATAANGRLRDGAMTGMIVEVDGLRGNVLDWHCAYGSLLESLQKIALIGGGDFDLVKTTAATWQFRWYSGQLGSDRSETVIFALERGNMENPQYKNLRIDEKTVCIAGGRGETTERLIEIRSGENYASGNDIEMFTNASNPDTAAGMQAQADSALNENRAKTTFDFGVLQTPATRYGVDYQLGDLVTAINPFTNEALTLKVKSVNIQVGEAGGEKITVQMEVA